MEGSVNAIQVVVRRVGGGETVRSVHSDVLSAVAAEVDVIGAFRRDGFRGGCNAAGVYRLAKRQGLRRIRLSVFLRELPRSWN